MDGKLQGLIEKYASFIVRTALNLQKGQTLILTCPVESAYFARMCAAAAYEAGANEVAMHYADDVLSRMRMERASDEALENPKPWLLASRMDYMDNPAGVCNLNVVARDPEVFKGLDTARVDRSMMATNRLMRPWMEVSMADRVQWCVAAIPGEAWAKKVFPGEAPDAAQEKLWRAILQASRADGGNPDEAWLAHSAGLEKRRDALNEMNLVSLHLQSKNGTDLTVGLAEDCVWGGGGGPSDKGVIFHANVPTEEVFTAPHRLRTEGVVKSSMPYVYNGNLIEGITFRFEKGVAVEYAAEKGNDLLQQMMAADEGAKHIGEIALVPASSPIRQTGLLFYNTLFDENASCHMAVGRAYPSCIRDFDKYTPEQLAEKGLNDSFIHEDIMIGTGDMDITGQTADGRTVQLFRDGEWVI